MKPHILNNWQDYSSSKDALLNESAFKIIAETVDESLTTISEILAINFPGYAMHCLHTILTKDIFVVKKGIIEPITTKLSQKFNDTNALVKAFERLSELCIINSKEYVLNEYALNKYMPIPETAEEYELLFTQISTYVRKEIEHYIKLLGNQIINKEHTVISTSSHDTILSQPRISLNLSRPFPG